MNKKIGVFILIVVFILSLIAICYLDTYNRIFYGNRFSYSQVTSEACAAYRKVYSGRKPSFTLNTSRLIFGDIYINPFYSSNPPAYPENINTLSSKEKILNVITSSLLTETSTEQFIMDMNEMGYTVSPTKNDGYYDNGEIERTTLFYNIQKNSIEYLINPSIKKIRVYSIDNTVVSVSLDPFLHKNISSILKEKDALYGSPQIVYIHSITTNDKQPYFSTFEYYPNLGIGFMDQTIFFFKPTSRPDKQLIYRQSKQYYKDLINCIHSDVIMPLI
jgi:hypothetical protein